VAPTILIGDQAVWQCRAYPITDGGLTWVAAEPLRFTSATDSQSPVRRLHSHYNAYPARMSLAAPGGRITG
jgi:hypothetical protein